MTDPRQTTKERDDARRAYMNHCRDKPGDRKTAGKLWGEFLAATERHEEARREYHGARSG